MEKGFRSARPSCGTAVGADSELDIFVGRAELLLTFFFSERGTSEGAIPLLIAT